MGNVRRSNKTNLSERLEKCLFAIFLIQAVDRSHTCPILPREFLRPVSISKGGNMRKRWWHFKTVLPSTTVIRDITEKPISKAAQPDYLERIQRIDKEIEALRKDIVDAYAKIGRTI